VSRRKLCTPGLETLGKGERRERSKRQLGWGKTFHAEVRRTVRDVTVGENTVQLTGEAWSGHGKKTPIKEVWHINQGRGGGGVWGLGVGLCGGEFRAKGGERPPLKKS